ncbi:sensor histidine kinase [Actinoplanes sp. L3-i22]|uniref:sensor histidine kinase n=1 Tax=Actinoplanes sp. L3-i22 TaxID=2836373 RepID=UPI002105224A|nr:histidine kinase [Actinoplanes sp. L3-i22]
MNFIYLAAAATLVGVPAGLAATDGNATIVMTVSLAIFLAGLVLAARRRPRLVLILSVLTVTAWRMAYLTDSGWVWPATAALVLTVLAGRLRTAVITCVLALTTGAFWDQFVVSGKTEWVFAHVGGEGLWLAAVLAGSVAYRNTARWRDELGRRLAREAHERELESRRRRAEERVEIARDLHDVVSHTLAVVGVHLNVALDAFDEDPEEARASLRLAQQVRGGAMTDLKSLVGVLREGEVPSLASVQRLADRVRAAGLPVTVNEFGDPVEVPAPVATAVYRVVQEALTNVVRHSAATHAIITIRYSPGGVLVDIQDDGHETGPVTDGHGITGMRERVAALGGALTAGPGRNGFSVRASIPMKE